MSGANRDWEPTGQSAESIEEEARNQRRRVENLLALLLVIIGLGVWYFSK